MHCRKCDGQIELSPFRVESLKRFRQFSLLAAALLLVGAILHLAAIAIWPYWLYAASAFVMLQALLKWQDSRWVSCRQCGERYTYYSRFSSENR